MRSSHRRLVVEKVVLGTGTVVGEVVGEGDEVVQGGVEGHDGRGKWDDKDEGR